MLRVTVEEAAAGEATIALDGHLVGTWVAAQPFEDLVAAPSARNIQVRLAGVTFIDEAG